MVWCLINLSGEPGAAHSDPTFHSKPWLDCSLRQSWHLGVRGPAE